MIGTVLAVLAVFTLYLVLFPNPGVFVPLAYVATLVLLGTAVCCIRASRLSFLVLAAAILVLVAVLTRALDVFTWFALIYAASAAAVLFTLRVLPGGQAAWTSALLVTLLMAMLEAHYFLDEGYTATPSRSITVLTAAAFLSVALFAWLGRLGDALRGRFHRPRAQDPGRGTNGRNWRVKRRR